MGGATTSSSNPIITSTITITSSTTTITSATTTSKAKPTLAPLLLVSEQVKEASHRGDLTSSYTVPY